MKLKGKKISEVPQKSELNGEELIPFAQNNDNGSVTVDTIAKYAYDKEGGDFTSRLAYDIQVPGIEFIADRAEKDAFGNIITDTYVTRSTAKNAMTDALKEQLPDAIKNIKKEFVTPDMLSEETKQLFGAETIVNLPDNEDITINSSKQLTFADKSYNPIIYSGMGCKRLRKHMINGVNTLTQNMFSDENTRYIIQYNYNLNGSIINIPNNCVLQFEGGSIDNGTLIGNGTIIVSSPLQIFEDNLILGGEFVGEGMVEYYGCYPNNSSNDVCVAIQKLYKGFKTIKLNVGHYYTTTGNTKVSSIKGVSKTETIIHCEFQKDGDYLFSVGDLNDLNGINYRTRYQNIESFQVEFTTKNEAKLHNCTGIVVGNMADSSIRHIRLDLYNKGLVASLTELKSAVNDSSVEDTFNVGVRFRGYCEISEFDDLRILATIGIKGESTSSTLDALSFSNITIIGGGTGYANNLFNCHLYNISYIGYCSWNQFVYGIKTTKAVGGVYINGLRTEQPLTTVKTDIGRQIATSFYINSSDNNVRLSIQNVHVAGEANGIYLAGGVWMDVVLSNIFTYTNATGFNSTVHLQYALKIAENDSNGMITTNNVMLPYSDVILRDWGIVDNSEIHFYGNYFAVHSIRNAVITNLAKQPRYGFVPKATNTILEKYIRTGVIDTGGAAFYSPELHPSNWGFETHSASCEGLYVMKDSDGNIFASNSFKFTIDKNCNKAFDYRDGTNEFEKRIRFDNEDDNGSRCIVVVRNEGSDKYVAFQNTSVTHTIELYYKITYYNSNYTSLTQKVEWTDN